MRSILTFLIFLALVGPAIAVDGLIEINHTCAVQTGCFAGDTIGFPVTISASSGGSSYRLTSDLVIPDVNTDGIRVDTDSIAIDLNGFYIARSGCETNACDPIEGIGDGISGGALTEVRNGSIRGVGRYGTSPRKGAVTGEEKPSLSIGSSAIRKNSVC